MAFTIFAESFLDGFTFPGVLSRARREGAPTQVFAPEPVQDYSEPAMVAFPNVVAGAQVTNYLREGRDIVAERAATAKKAVRKGAQVIRGKDGELWEVAKPAYDEPSERKSER